MVARQSRPSIIGLLVRVASALSLVIAMMVSPFRPPRSVNGPSGQLSVRRNFAVTSANCPAPARVSATTDGSRPVRLKAVSSENEKEDFNETARHASGTVDALDISSPKLTGQSLNSDPALAVHPLRC